MNHNKARMLVAGMTLTMLVSSAIHASMGDQRQFSGRFSQLAAGYQAQGENTSLQGFSCTAAETISASMFSDEWQQAFRDVLHLSADNFTPAEASGASPVKGHRGAGDMAHHFRRIEILQYAQTQVLDVAPNIAMPAHARATALAMQARYHSFMLMGLNTLTQEYHQPGASGQAVITPEKIYGHSDYLNPCLNSSKRLVVKVVAEFRAMSQEA